MNWCFKKILSLLNISLTSSKDKNNNKDLNKYVTYINNGHYYFDINDYNDESEDFIWQKDIISNVDNLFKKYRENEFKSDNGLINRLIKQLFNLIFLNYKRLFYSNEIYRNGYQYLLKINDEETNFRRAKDLITINIPNWNIKIFAFFFRYFFKCWTW